MKAMRLRHLTRQYGDLGYILVGIYLLLRVLCKQPRSWMAGTMFFLMFLIFGRHTATRPGVQSAMSVALPTSTASYAVEDLGTLGGKFSEGVGINDGGQIVGSSETANGSIRAFLWQHSAMQDIGTIGGGSCQAFNINKQGQIVGKSGERAFLWQKGKMKDLGALPGYTKSCAMCINNQGAIAGYSFYAEYAGRAFVWQNGKMKDLGALPDDEDSMAYGMNDKETIVGESMWEGDAHAFVYNDGYMTELPTLGGLHNSAVAVNNNLEVVGVSLVRRDDEYTMHGFLWQGGKPLDLGTLGGGQSRATCINNKTQVVGWSYTRESEKIKHAFLWQRSRITDINTLLPKNSGWLLERADGINDKGQIVGTGLHNGQRRAFLLTPAR